MIYDEGFQISLMNKTFFAFSKYTIASEKKPNDTDDE